jgi:hypothetical protein
MKHLTLADEIVVLMLDDAMGEIKPGCLAVAGVAIAAGALMELALQGRIDTDLESLFVIDRTLLGDALLDDMLLEVAAEPRKQSSAWWIDQLGTRHVDLVERVLGRLVTSGILKEEERKFLWVFSRRAYPPVSGKEQREAKGRLMSVLFNDEVPEPRDTLLLGLAKSTGVLSAILTSDELDKATPRIEEVAALEEIGRAVGVVTGEVRAAVASIMMAHYP